MLHLPNFMSTPLLHCKNQNAHMSCSTPRFDRLPFSQPLPQLLPSHSHTCYCQQHWLNKYSAMSQTIEFRSPHYNPHILWNTSPHPIPHVIISLGPSPLSVPLSHFIMMSSVTHSSPLRTTCNHLVLPVLPVLPVREEDTKRNLSLPCLCSIRLPKIPHTKGY